MSTAKKATKEAKAPSVLYKVTVIKKATIGSMICQPGTQAKLTEAKAKTLEKEGFIKINGIA